MNTARIIVSSLKRPFNFVSVVVNDLNVFNAFGLVIFLNSGKTSPGFRNVFCVLTSSLKFNNVVPLTLKPSASIATYNPSFRFLQLNTTAATAPINPLGATLAIPYEESFDLNFNLGTLEVTIATLTNIVVVANGDNLSATFSVELNIPDEADFDACNVLEGDYFAAKDDPMEGSESATADTNHAKIIKSWTLVSSVYDGENQTSMILFF